ncbi:TPA: lipopolysaccharide biosynthesis protein, partial [Aeromonas veronii]
MRSDRIFVERYLGFDDLAMYGVAIQIFEQLGLLIGIIIQSIGPKFIFKKVAQPKLKVLSIIFVITVCIQLASAVLLPPFIVYVYGDEFNKAASMAIYMLPALIFYGFDVVYMQYIYRDKLYNLLFVKWLLMLIIGLTAYYIWFTLLDETSIVYVFNFNYIMM